MNRGPNIADRLAGRKFDRRDRSALFRRESKIFRDQAEPSYLYPSGRFLALEY